MKKRKCTCGAEAEARLQTSRLPDGRDVAVWRVVCPVCGQLGPAIPVEGRDEETGKAEALAAWNAMIAKVRPLEDE